MAQIRIEKRINRHKCKCSHDILSCSIYTHLLCNYFSLSKIQFCHTMYGNSHIEIFLEYYNYTLPYYDLSIKIICL